MDVLQAKALADLSFGAKVPEDQFYEQHSFARMHRLCACLRWMLRPKTGVHAAPRPQVIKP